MRRRRVLLAATGATVAVAVGVAVAVLALSPAGQATAKAAFVLDGAFGGPLPRPWAPPVERGEERLGGVAVDRYSPGDDAPPVLVVPGAAPAGRDDERVVAFASSLAAAGREVVVPELALYAEKVTVEDVDRVVDVAAQLCAEGDRLVLFGFSFGGSLALVAAADDRVAGCIDLVATFGAYGDLVGVIQAAVTGVSVVGGETYPWEAADQSVVRTVVRDAATSLVPEEQRGPLLRALEAGDPTGLPEAAGLVYRIVNADDPELVADLAERLPPPGGALVETFSPVDVADEIEADVLAVHALDDPAVPAPELLRLHRAFPDAEVMVVDSFRHVDLDTGDGLGPLVGDLLTVWSAMQEVLAAQEDWG